MSATPTFAGTWATDFSKLCVELRPDGTAHGAYTHEEGRIEGAAEGPMLRGTWVQPGNGREGTFEFTLGAEGNAFTGVWRYAGDGAWRGAWNGARLERVPAEQGGSPGGWGSHASGPLLAGPMLGEVGETEARVWAQARGAGPLTLTAQAEDGEVIRRVAVPSWDEFRCVTIHVDDLRPGVAWTYTIEGDGGRTGPFPLRLAPPRDARRARLVFGSCYWDFPNPALRIFDAIGRERPDALVMLGDTSYFGPLDWQGELPMMLAHLRHRNGPALRALIASTPTLGVWDDHDFGPNDADGRFEGKPAALRAFTRMWAQARYGAAGIPGLFSSVRVGPVEIFLLDSRYHRRDPDRVILGAAQLEWLVAALLESDAAVKIVASPTQVLPEIPARKGWDCFRRDAPGELEALLGAIEGHDIRGVVFLSGDLHMANLIHVPGRPTAAGKGPELWELTTSPLANDPWREPANGEDPTIVAEIADRVNYGLVDVDLDREGAEIVLALHGEDGSALIEQRVLLASLEAR